MKEIVNRLKENRDIERAKAILESNGYKVEKKLEESAGESHPAWEYYEQSPDSKGPAEPNHYYKEYNGLYLTIYPPQDSNDDWQAEITGDAQNSKNIEEIQDGLGSFEEAEQWINQWLEDNDNADSQNLKESYKGLSIAPFREFTKDDYRGFGGANKIGNEEPLIYEDDTTIIIISGDDDSNRMCTVGVYVSADPDSLDDSGYYTEEPLSFPKALRLGKEIASKTENPEELIYWCEDNLSSY